MPELAEKHQNSYSMSRFNAVTIASTFTLATISNLTFVVSTAQAETYDALCGDSGCSISVDARGVSGPGGFIPSELVSKWTVGTDSGYHGGKGVAGGLGGATAGAVGGALLLGPIGLLGGLIGGAVAGSGAGKEFDGYFTVVGYNKDGEKISNSFRFINKKPANRLRTALPAVTGLSMGEERTAEELEVAYADYIQGKPSSSDGLPARLGVGNTNGREVAATTRPQQPKPAAGGLLSWDGYLEQRNLIAWAEANPEMAEQLRQKLIAKGEISA
ncbi:hypothetical protein [Synechococcus sp. CC9616]|uniref:hypothetical protein n=1 Tax=Synechococcus sp. CC9616 TaxID=110663 RepID=UPI0004909332|nr:hypothetical protein [Synechococcus sp. CC9616]